MPFRRLLRRLGFALVASVLGLLALEGLARAAIGFGFLWFVPPAVQSYVTSNHLVYDPNLGWRPAAVAANVDTRALGLDRTRLSPEAAPGRLRGFALGDSQTQGGGVFPQEAWPAVAEKLLQKDGLDVELINAGSPGYRSAQVLELLETRLVAWDADFLIVDCRTRDSPRLERHHDPEADRIAGLLFESRLYRLLRLGIAQSRGEDIGIPHPAKIQQAEGPDQEGPGNHAAIAAVAQTWGIDVWFVDYPYNDGRDGLRAGYEREALPPGAHLIELTPAFAASGEPVTALFQDMNHMTVAGNIRAAERVAAAIEPRLRERAAR